MKLALIIVAVFGVVLAQNGQLVPWDDVESTLRQDLGSIIAILPTTEIAEITAAGRENPDIQMVYDVLAGENFDNAVRIVAEQYFTTSIFHYLWRRGLNVYGLWNRWATSFNFRLLAPPIQRGGVNQTPRKQIVEKRNVVENVAWNEMIDEIRELEFMQDAINQAASLMETSEDFREFEQKLQDFQEYFAAAKQLPEVQAAADEFRDVGVDIDAIIYFIMNLMGWFPPEPESLRYLKV